jgi:hypothetical protein
MRFHVYWQVLDFKAGNVWKVMVASYETLRKHTEALAGCVDLLVCDEGHRLKAAAGSKTISALLALRCPRRILVTGTPLQNNLDEFFGEQRILAEHAQILTSPATYSKCSMCDHMYVRSREPVHQEGLD